MSYLKARGKLREPKRPIKTWRAIRHPRPYAIRKPKDYRVRAPGNLVEIDTLDVPPLPRVILKQFTTRDVVSRWDVVEAHQRATVAVAAKFSR
jgi:hypothetical protein